MKWGTGFRVPALIFVFILGIFILFLFYRPQVLDTFAEPCTAIIVEPRKHPALSYVLHNFIENLPDNWSIVLAHGSANADFVHAMLAEEFSNSADRIATHNLGVENLTIDDYNELLKSREFYHYIPTETFLVFQTDTAICGEDRELLDQFLQYDYVGAPWKDAVGNGGLSLRKKSKMLEIIDKCPKGKENEDVYFANPCVDIYKPSIDEAKLFSVELLYSDRSFGVHKPWLHMDPDELDQKVARCAPLRKLIDLNA